MVGPFFFVSDTDEESPVVLSTLAFTLKHEKSSENPSMCIVSLILALITYNP